MKETITDKAIKKVSKGKISTIQVTKEEMAEMVDKHYIQAATTEKDYQEIWKVIKRGCMFDKILNSKDGNFQMRSKSWSGGGFRKYIWIHDIEENTFYEYRYWSGFYGPFKRMVRNKINVAKTNGI